MLSVLDPYNLPNTESVSLIMYPSDCNTQSPIGTAKRLPKLFLLKLPLTKTGGEHPFQFSTCSHEKDLMGNFRISYLVLFRQL